MDNTVHSALIWAQQELVALPSSRLDAVHLLAHVLGKSQAYLITYPEHAIDNDTLDIFATLVASRAAGNPLAYLLGDMSFMGRNFDVNRHTLVPRPETEELVEWVLAFSSKESLRCIDLGTGSGVIAVSLALARRDWSIMAVDVSAAALAVAQRNAQQLGADGVMFIEQDGLLGQATASILRSVDLVVSNPPYIAENDPHLQRDGVCFEPRLALVAGNDGLAFIRRMVDEAKSLLCRQGCLVFEHGYDQAQSIATLLYQAGYASVEHGKDASGKQIFTKAMWPGG